MKVSRPRVPRGLIIAIVVCLAIGLIAIPVVNNTFTQEELAKNVLLAAIPFLFIFVSILLTYITLIVIVATMLNNNIPVRTFERVEKIVIAFVLLGIIGMFQSWFFKAYTLGFILLLFSLLTYILWSHIMPKVVQQRNNPEDDFAPTQVV
jgi:ABC-type transport system involved in cytochrome c biogenesis permease subunit